MTLKLSTLNLVQKNILVQLKLQQAMSPGSDYHIRLMDCDLSYKGFKGY